MAHLATVQPLKVRVQGLRVSIEEPKTEDCASGVLADTTCPTGECLLSTNVDP